MEKCPASSLARSPEPRSEHPRARAEVPKLALHPGVEPSQSLRPKLKMQIIAQSEEMQGELRVAPSKGDPTAQSQ